MKCSMDNKNDFKPYIPADKIVPEFTVTSVLIGCILAVVFGAANAYLGLLVGMTVSASIPAAVISMGIIRIILRRDSILENNMVQTIGSAGESLAAGAIFTLPALFLWAEEGKIEFPSILTIFLIALFGGILGVCFMVPLRQALIVEEHGTLPFPEGTACAEVLLAGEEGGSKAGSVFKGLGIAAVYKFIADGLGFFPSEIGYAFKGFAGSQIGIQVLPSLAGVGFICGPKISSYMLAGGTLSWFVLMPAIALFGGDAVIFPGEVPISTLAPDDLWDTYVKYIGAGAVAAGGLISLIKTFPLIIRTFRQAMKSMSKNHSNANALRTQQDLPMPLLLGMILVIVIAIWLVPTFPVNPIGALIVVIFGFFFASVSSRMVGLIGSSNNPVSGMAIATLIIATLLLKITGSDGTTGMVGAIAIGGPGAVFWMWVVGFIAMGLKFSEATLGVATRVRDKDRNWKGGAYVYLSKVWKPLGIIWGLFASITFPRAVYWGNRLKDWNTRPKCSRFLRISLSCTVVGSSASNRVSPFTRMIPPSGRSRKYRLRRSVVFPLPEEPMIESTCPFSREKVISLSTSVRPKLLLKCSTSKIAICTTSYLKNSSFFSNRPRRTVKIPLNTR